MESYKTIKVRLVEDKNGTINIGFNKTYRIEEILDDEDKDIPLIPDDELFLMKNNGADIRGFDYLDYNFKVLQEKINQVVKEFNEYRKEDK